MKLHLQNNGIRYKLTKILSIDGGKNEANKYEVKIKPSEK